MLAVIIYNIFVVLSFTSLSIVFDRWWIIFFAILFLNYSTKTITTQYNRICDKCGKRSPWGNSPKEAIKEAQKCGWQHIEETNKDYCPDCLDSPNNHVSGGK